MIVMTVGTMLVHNLLDLRRKADPRYRTLPMAHLAAERLNRNERVQHAILASSFLLLVLTGFALRFPNSWLSVMFSGETLRRFLHRAAAVVMVLLGFYHLAYMVATRSGRRALREMRPGLHDFHEAVGTVSFNLGFRKVRPESPHFGYPEKMEYWAVIWGTAVMAITGFMLWFKIAATQSAGLPLWAIDLALVIHYYEAWLATLAIVVWHLYFVIFDPAVYPMNWAWLKGWIRGRAPTEGPPPGRTGEQETGNETREQKTENRE
jgi:cytochrome b subunit of formate dehydrogenase